MDNHATDTFFALLRSGLYGKAIPDIRLPDCMDWDAILVLAHRHAVLGVIIESVQYLPERLRPSEQIYGKMQQFALRLIQSNIRLDKQVGRVVSFFEQHDIHGVLLKGQGVARAYREPKMRTTGDIDFYVGKSQYRRAFEACGNLVDDDHEDFDECNKHFHFKSDGVMTEVHRIASETYTSFKKNKLQRWMESELATATNRRTAQIGNATVTLPSPDFDAIYIFYHALQHFMIDGIGLRQLCDWAMIFRAYGHTLDITKLTRNIRRFGLTRSWKLFAIIAVDYLGVSKSHMPLYDPSYAKKSEILLHKILTGGNFGWYAPINATASGEKLGLRNALSKLRHTLGYMLYTFPLLPAEAIGFYLHRLKLIARKPFTNKMKQ